ncbi:MAG: glycosyltransferase family 4 protein [Candidatus Zambryskibacteria bacterium]
MLGKKKILYVITKGNFGGAQRYVYDLATHLSKSDFDIVVACGPSSAKAIAGKEGLAEMLKDKGVRVIELKSSQRDINISKDIKTFFEIKKIIKEERPDVIHLNSSKIGGLGALVGRMARVPKIIFTGHGWAFNENRGLLPRTIILFLHWLTILLCHTTIAVSDKAKKDINYLPFIKNKIKVVYNGIEKFETLPREEARKILTGKNPSTGSGQVIIFSISELHKNKGIDVALSALALLPKEKKEKIIYSIAGVDGGEKENLEKLVSELDIADMVRFLGFVPDAKKLLSGSDIFLLPSRTEAFPYAPLEAGLVGLPIIATSVGGVPEVIRDMQNGILVHPRNPKEIAEAIMYLLDHPEKQKEFGEEIKKIVSNFFSLDKMLSETINLYN